MPIRKGYGPTGVSFHYNKSQMLKDHANGIIYDQNGALLESNLNTDELWTLGDSVSYNNGLLTWNPCKRSMDELTTRSLTELSQTQKVLILTTTNTDDKFLERYTLILHRGLGEEETKYYLHKPDTTIIADRVTNSDHFTGWTLEENCPINGVIDFEDSYNDSKVIVNQD